MTTASPPAPSARILFFSPLRRPQPRPHAGRISTWPFRVASDRDRDDGNDIRMQAARVIRTTAEQWWPPAE
jgi:hypothetical protein